MNSATAAAIPRSELTIRGLVIGVIITLVFTAANVYAGLKAGLTFSTSIPAAVISMALLKAVRDATIQENNIVQTVASAAGTLSSIIFVLPGLVMIGWWTGFPFWTSFGICVTGGILGVMYTIPLRRALVTDSDLPYPEGVACAEVLKVGAGGSAEKLGNIPVETRAHADAPPQQAQGAAEASSAGLRAVVMGAILSAIFYVIVQTRIFASDVASYFRIGDRGSASGFDFSLSFMLFGVGHLVGLWVGVAMGVGALIGWAWAVPHFTALHPAAGAAADIAQGAWSHYVRFVGAGTIGVAAIYTLAKLVKPVVAGLAGALRASRARSAGTLASMPRTEHDMPIGMVGLISLLCLIPIAILLWHFSRTSGLGDHAWLLTIGGVLFVVILSFVVSAVCGYMAGLIGSSNSPLSGIGILVVIIAALLLVFTGVQEEVGTGKAVVAFALFITAIVFAVASIANNNLQDLKTGQLVDATPEKQQWALVIGVIAGALVIPPVLNLMQQAFGFNGAPGADPARALPAPQAGLISALAQGVITHNIDWSLIGIGAVIGVAVIIVDEILRRVTGKTSLPPLAVGLGIYLPTSTTLMVVVGAIVGAWFDKRAERGRNAEGAKQLGVLLASGLIVGESLLAVLYALLIAFADQLGFKNPGAPLTLVGEGFAMPALIIGGLVFAAIVAATYLWAARAARS